MAEKLLLSKLLNPKGLGDVRTLRITGSCFNEDSHSITNCVDVSRLDTAYTFYAPVDMYCLEISGSANTAYFQSVNEVEFANGQTGILSMTFGHAASVPVSVSTTDFIPKGTRIYTEGISGLANADADDRHCHIRVGKGAFISPKLIYNGYGCGWDQYDINTVNGPMTISDAFYSDTMSFIYGTEPDTEADKEIKKKYYWRETTDELPAKVSVDAIYAAFNIRKAPSTSYAVRYTVPKGSSARIVTFMPKFESDGYQWAFVDYNNGQHFGYAQLDLNNNQIIDKDNYARPLKLEAINSKIEIKNTVTGTTKLGEIPVGGKADINFLTSSKATDNYQWANVTYNGVTGYAKLDLYSVANLNFDREEDQVE